MSNKGMVGQITLTKQERETLKSVFQYLATEDQKWEKKKGWSKKHIEKKRRYLNLKRTEEQKDAIQQRNVDNGRFLLCVVKRWEKTGQAPEGEIRYWREKSGRMVPRVKINGRFIHWARWRYESLYGKVAKGLNVVFIDGNPRNISDDNLGLLSDAEMSKRNSKISSTGLSDNYVASIMSLKNPELRAEIKKRPELIELKRSQLQLNRAIQNERKNNSKS